MGESQYTVKAILELLYRGRGGKEAAAQLETVTKESKKAEAALDDASTATNTFGRSLVAAVGGAALIAFARSSIILFADWERQLGATAIVARNFGLNTVATVQYVRNLTTALEQQTGVLRQDTTPAFNRFLGLTGDLQQATLLTRASIGAQRQGFGELAQTSTLLANILQGRVGAAATALGITFDKTTSAAEQNAAVLRVALDRLTDLGDTADDTKSEFEELAASGNEVKLTLGEALAPVIRVITSLLSGAIRVVRALGELMGTMASSAVQAFTGLGRVIAATFDIKTLFTDPKSYLLRLTEAVSKEAALQVGIYEDARKRELEILFGANTEQIQSIAAAAKAREELLAAADARAAVARQERIEDEAAAALKAAEATAEFDQRIQDRILRARIEAAKEGSKEQLDLEIEMLTRLRLRAIEEAEDANASVSAVNSLFDAMEADRRALFDEEQAAARKKRREELGEAELEEAEERERLIEEFNERQEALHEELFEAELDLLDEQSDERFELLLEDLEGQKQARIDNAQTTGEEIEDIEELFRRRRLKIEKDFADAEVKIVKLTNKEKAQAAVDIANQTIALGVELFGRTKALAIAQVVVDTAQGVMNVWSKWGSVPVVAGILSALVVATGLAQIRNIKSAAPGSASIGGAGGGGAAVPRAPQEVPTLPNSGVTFPTATTPAADQNATIINFNGPAIVDRVALRRFARQIETARRIDRRTRLLGSQG